MVVLAKCTAEVKILHWYIMRGASSELEILDVRGGGASAGGARFLCASSLSKKRASGYKSSRPCRTPLQAYTLLNGFLTN